MYEVSIIEYSCLPKVSRGAVHNNSDHSNYNSSKGVQSLKTTMSTVSQLLAVELKR